MRKQDKKGWIVLLVILVLVAISTTLATSKPTPKQQTQPTTLRQENPNFDTKPTSEEIAERERLAEKKRAADLERRRQLEEERALLEAQRAANRLTIAEFEVIFLDRVGNIFRTMGVADYATMGEPTRYVNGTNETLIYPLDETGDLKMKVYAKNGGVTGLTVSTDDLNRETLFTVSVLYNVAALQVLSTPTEAEANNILHALSLDENVFKNLSKTQSTTLNGYHYSKTSSGKNFSLSANER